MMRRLLVLLAAVLAIVWWFGRRRPQRPRPSGRPRQAPAVDTMVRDRVCNTFLPRSRALVLGSGDDQLFFCSEACRDAHSAAQKSR